MTASTPKSSTTASRSGIQKLQDGNSVIPASIRADGSIRKEIRVKPGYRPPEDVEVYKNRTAHAFQNRSGGVPGAESVQDGSFEDNTAAATASAAKNAKRREARKRAAAGTAEQASNLSPNQDADDASRTSNSKDAASLETQSKDDPESDRLKEARKLAKKLRQARDLKSKKDEGGGLLPEQIAKVIKINELVRQLDHLGFDENGDPKATD
jgi:partner of Y14 and mago protein